MAPELPGEQSLPLCRLRFTGVLHTWGFALYLASNDSYRDNILSSGLPAGSPEEALDCAGDLYLNALAPAIRVPAGLRRASCICGVCCWTAGASRCSRWPNVYGADHQRLRQFMAGAPVPGSHRPRSPSSGRRLRRGGCRRRGRRGGWWSNGDPSTARRWHRRGWGPGHGRWCASACGVRAAGDRVPEGTIDLRFTGEGVAPGRVNVAYGLCPSWRGGDPATRAVLPASRYAAAGARRRR